MKKIISLLLATVMLVSLLPISSFALSNTAGTLWSDPKINLTFSTVKENTDGTSYYFTNEGVAGNFTPVSGVFGKAADDISVKVQRITNADKAYSNVKVNIKEKQPASGGLLTGEILSINWNWAFGDFQNERYVNATFYKSSAIAWDVVDSYSYSGSTKQEDILRITPNGSVRFFGKTLDKAYYFDINKWYNFEIRVTQGSPTVTSDGQIVDPGVKPLAELYVDGVKIGEKGVNSASDDSTTINKLFGLYSLNFCTKAVRYTDTSDALPDTTYIDDLQCNYFKKNANHESFRWFRNSIVDDSEKNLTLSSKSDNFIIDSLHQIALKNSMSVADLKADISYSTSDIISIDILDDKYNAVTDTSLAVQPGWYIKVGISSNSFNHYFYRKIIDSVTYYKNEFEGSAASTSIPGITWKNYEWGSTNSYGTAVNDGLKLNNKAYKASTIGDKWTLKECYLRYHSATCDFYDKYVIEASVMRQNNTGDYPGLKIVQNGIGTIIEIEDNVLYLAKDNSEFSSYYSKDGKLTNRWFDVAIEIDQTEKTAKIYINGEYTGVTRTVNSTPLKGSNNIFSIQLSKNIPVGSKGSLSLDNFRVYSGSYKVKDLDVSSENISLVPAANETITVAGDISVADLKTATGATAIYSYANGSFGTEITSGNAADGNVAVFKNADGVIRYLDIVLLPIVDEVTFDTSVSGKITANVSYENRSATKKITSGMLVIANRTNDEINVINLDKKDDTSDIGIYDYSATVDYASGDNIVAYFWEDDLTPFYAPTPYTAQ